MKKMICDRGERDMADRCRQALRPWSVPVRITAVGEPDDDLCEADSADADDLAGHHLFGADGGEQHLEDARGLLFDDGAGDVHAVEQDDHVHEEEEDVGGDELEDGVGVLACLGRVDLDGLHERVDVAGDHAVVGEPLAHAERCEARCLMVSLVLMSAADARGCRRSWDVAPESEAGVIQR